MKIVLVLMQDRSNTFEWIDSNLRLCVRYFNFILDIV